MTECPVCFQGQLVSRKTRHGKISIYCNKCRSLWFQGKRKIIGTPSGPENAVCYFCGEMFTKKGNTKGNVCSSCGEELSNRKKTSRAKHKRIVMEGI